MVLVLSLTMSISALGNNRVVFEFEAISDKSGYVYLKWNNQSLNDPIQVTGYSIIDSNNIKVSYRTGDEVLNNNRILITSDSIEYPIRVILEEQQSSNKKLIDLPDNQMSKNHIIHLYDRGVISGYTDNTFRPENNVTREEFATMIVMAAHYEVESNVDSPFTDVSNDSWSKDYITTLANKGILAGRGNGLFDPNGKITIGEVIAIIDRAFRIHSNDTAIFENPTGSHFTIEQGNYTSLIRQGIIKSEDHFAKPYNPTVNATREDCAILLSRALEQLYEVK